MQQTEMEIVKFLSYIRNFRMPKIDKEKFALLLILIFGSILRIFMLDSKPFWFDEVYSVETAKPPLIDTLKSLMKSSPSEYPQAFFTPPLYYILLHLLMYFNDSNFAIRFVLSVIPGVIVIAVAYRLAYVLFSPRVALLSAFIISFSPLPIIISQLARPYALHTLFTLMSLLFFYKSLETNRRLMWALFVLSNIMNTYTHYYAFFVVLAEVLYFYVFALNKKVRSNLLKSLIIIGVAYIPWAYVLITDMLGGFSTPPSHLLHTTPVNLILVTMYKWPIGLRRTTLVDWKVIASLAMPFFYFFFVKGILIGIQKENKIKSMLPIVVILTTISTPILIWLAVSRNFLLLSRYFWFLSPLYFMFVSNGVYDTINRKNIIISVAFILIVYLYLLYDYYLLIDKENWALLVGV